MKFCTKCTTLKPKTDFYKSAAKPDGLQVRCKSCNRKGNVSFYASSENRRTKVKETRTNTKKKNKYLVDRYKRMCKCKHCGEDDPIVLDLHHVDPAGKDAGPSQLLGGSLEVLREEIRKCIVLCSNCHRREHHRLRTMVRQADG